MLSGDSTHCGARATVLTVVLDQGRHQSTTAGPHSSKHKHTHTEIHAGLSIIILTKHEHTLLLKHNIYTHLGGVSLKENVHFLRF